MGDIKVSEPCIRRIKRIRRICLNFCINPKNPSNQGSDILLPTLHHYPFMDNINVLFRFGKTYYENQELSICRR